MFSHALQCRSDIQSRSVWCSSVLTTQTIFVTRITLWPAVSCSFASVCHGEKKQLFSRVCDLNSSSLWGQDAFVEDFFFFIKEFFGYNFRVYVSTCCWCEWLLFFNFALSWVWCCFFLIMVTAGVGCEWHMWCFDYEGLEDWLKKNHKNRLWCDEAWGLKYLTII